MTETNSKKGFWHFPITLKFVVIWIFLLSLSDFWNAFDSYIYDRSIRIVPIILGVVYFYLAIGLADRSNASRIITSVVVSIGTLVRFVFLVLPYFLKDLSPGYITYHSMRFPLSQNQSGAFLLLNIALNAIILYVLLRPSTKALFSSPPASLSETSNSNHPETADPSSMIH